MSATPRARTEPAARFGVAVAAVLTLALAGCTLVDGARSGVAASSASTGESRTERDPETRVRLQAREALDRWEAAVEASGGASILFRGPLTAQIGSWAQGDNDAREALEAGRIEAGVALSNEPPAKGEVKYLDGRTVEVALLSAAAALDAIVEDGTGTCDGCTPIIVSDANLATDLVETTDGPAEAPHWVFTIQDSSVRVTRIAVDASITLTPPPWNAASPPVGISIDSAVGEAGSKEVTVAFLGAAASADEPCGADYAAEALESELAVVIIVTEERNGADGTCPLGGAFRTATVTLAKALGDRAILEVRQGLPVRLAPPAE